MYSITDDGLLFSQGPSHFTNTNPECFDCPLGATCGVSRTGSIEIDDGYWGIKYKRPMSEIKDSSDCISDEYIDTDVYQYEVYRCPTDYCVQE